MLALTDMTSSDNATDAAFLKVKLLQFYGIFTLCNSKHTLHTRQWEKKNDHVNLDLTDLRCTCK